jgi:hypothetical protein
MSGSDRHAVAVGTIFDGTYLHHDCTVVIEGARIGAPPMDWVQRLPQLVGIQRWAFAASHRSSSATPELNTSLVLEFFASPIALLLSRAAGAKRA